MKIRTRLELNTWISLGVAVLMLLSFAWAMREASKADRNARIAEAMLATLLDRVSLQDDYLLHREARAKAQWQGKSSSVRALLDAAAQSFTRPEDLALVAEARSNLESTLALFAEISRDGLVSAAGGSAYARGEPESRLTSQLLLKAYALSDAVGRLNESSRRLAVEARTREIVVMVLVLIAGTTALLINSSMLGGTVSRRILALQRGIETIGGGDLEHPIVVEGDDELSELARAGNEMSRRLKASYTSVENLRGEIEGRIRAEKERLKFQEIIDSSLNEIYIFDAVSLRFEYANQGAIANIGYSLEELRSLRPVDIKPDYPAEDYQRLIEPLVTGAKRHLVFESRQRRKDGSEYPVEVRLQMYSQGERAMFFAIINDISERKSAEERIGRLNDELEARVAERTAELLAKSEELERINRVFVDRELRMRELKERIAELEGRRP